jgi:polysaccharide export outer membrane protein
MKGPTTLVEALALAGGAAVDSGNTVKVTRRLGENGRIPLAEAKDDADAGLSIAEISLETVLKEDGSDQNIVIRPHDIISVSRAQLVYVVGEVTRAGGFPLNERKKMSVLQALTLAGGLTQDAAPKSAKILRQPEGSAQRVETAVNVRNILNGQEPDRELAANDILFVPGNSTKRVSRKLLETAIGTASGVVIYRSARY